MNICVCLEKLGRFAKRKLDEFVFLGNRLKVSYAPQFESVSDTRDKLESRRKEVLARLNCEHFIFFFFFFLNLPLCVRHVMGLFVLKLIACADL